MKLTLHILFISLALSVFSQNGSKTDTRAAVPVGIVRIDKESWKNDDESSSNQIIPAQGNENVSYGVTSEGITIIIHNGDNKIQLLALTGQILLSGNLTQGKFFISTRKGIYILKINNKSYKVVCK